MRLEVRGEVDGNGNARAFYGMSETAGRQRQWSEAEMNTRWKVTNCRHQHFQVQRKDGRWLNVGRIETEHMPTGYICATLLPGLHRFGFRVRVNAARRFTEVTVFRSLQKHPPWWLIELFHERGGRAFTKPRAYDFPDSAASLFE